MSGKANVDSGGDEKLNQMFFQVGHFGVTLATLQHLPCFQRRVLDKLDI